MPLAAWEEGGILSDEGTSAGPGQDPRTPTPVPQFHGIPTDQPPLFDRGGPAAYGCPSVSTGLSYPVTSGTHHWRI